MLGRASNSSFKCGPVCLDNVLGVEQPKPPKRLASKQHVGMRGMPLRVLDGGRLAREPRKASWLGASLAGGAAWLSISACQLWWMLLLAKDEEWTFLQMHMRLVSACSPS